MRTTLTIDDTLARALKRMAGKRETSMKEIVNQALREGLRVMEQQRPPRPYRTQARSLELRPGIDPHKLGQVVDEMDDVDKLRNSG